jgi:hypothetical protein
MKRRQFSGSISSQEEIRKRMKREYKGLAGWEVEKLQTKQIYSNVIPVSVPIFSIQS